MGDPSGRPYIDLLTFYLPHPGPQQTAPDQVSQKEAIKYNLG